MTQPRDPDAIIATWLEDGPADLPSDTRRAIAVGLRTQPRTTRMAVLGGSLMLPINRLVAAAAIVLAIGGLSAFVLSNRAGGPAATPAPSVPAASSATNPSSVGSTPTPSAPASGLGLFTDGTLKTYVSTRYGFSIAHPVDWTEAPSDHVWALPADANWLSTAGEGFLAPDRAVRVTAWSVSIHPAELVDRPTMTWIANTYCPLATKPCDGLEPRTAAISMDGHPGSLVQFADDTQAFILVGDRMYVVAVWEPDSDPRTAPYGGAQHLLKDFLSTMRLLPGAPAASGSSAPS